MVSHRDRRPHFDIKNEARKAKKGIRFWNSQRASLIVNLRFEMRTGNAHNTAK